MHVLRMTECAVATEVPTQYSPMCCLQNLLNWMQTVTIIIWNQRVTSLPSRSGFQSLHLIEVMWLSISTIISGKPL